MTWPASVSAASETSCSRSPTAWWCCPALRPGSRPCCDGSGWSPPPGACVPAPSHGATCIRSPSVATRSCLPQIRSGLRSESRRHTPTGRTYCTGMRIVRAGRAGGLVALAAVVGPGLLAGLSDDDAPGITTYSILGADYGYRLLWVLLLSTVALVLFHEIGARLGVVTGQGLAGLIRERYGV